MRNALPPISSWSDIGAIAQSVTAFASIVVAILAYKYLQKQTAISSALAINNAWNDLNKFAIQSQEANEAFSSVASPISKGPNAKIFDSVIYMHLNVQEMYHYLNENKAISDYAYRVILRDAGRMLKLVPNLEEYLDRGYNPKFAKSILKSVGSR